MGRYLLYIGLGLFFLFIIFLFFLKIKIDKFEQTIRDTFILRNSCIPIIFELSKNYVGKHEDIFKEYLRLKKIEFVLFYQGAEMDAFIDLESRIHHELNFIFKVCSNHRKLMNDDRFSYISGLLQERSNQLGKLLNVYKNIVLKYNFLLKIKDYTIIGLIFHFQKKI